MNKTNKAYKFLFALFIIPLLIPLVHAGTSLVGPAINVGQIGGTTVTTGAGASSAGTQRVILSNDSPSGVISAGSNNIGTVNGSTVAVSGQFLTSPPTLASGATQQLMMDNKGNTLVNVNVALPAGGNTIGAVNIAAAQTLATVTTVGAVTAITNALPAGTNSIGTVLSPASSAPTVTKVGATTTSAQLIAANATRKGIEIDCDCANTDSVAINFGAGAAVYASHKIMPPCSSFAPAPGVIITSAIQIISNTGTQNCRVVEYP